MNIEQLVTERLHREAAGRSPDQLLASTLDKVATTPQVKLLWPRRAAVVERRRPNRPLFAIAALLVSIGLLGALAIAGGRNIEQTTPTPSAPDETSNTIGPALPVAVANLPSGRYHADTQLESYWRWDLGTPSPAPEVMPLDAYEGRFMGARARVTFDLPAGWSTDGERVYKEGTTPSDGPVFHVGAISRVYRYPCSWSGGTSVDPLSTWSVEGTALALTSSWPDATGPTAVAFGGLAGLYCGSEDTRRFRRRRVQMAGRAHCLSTRAVGGTPL